jgi:hypothetical protein
MSCVIQIGVDALVNAAKRKLSERDSPEAGHRAPVGRADSEVADVEVLDGSGRKLSRWNRGVSCQR